MILSNADLFRPVVKSKLYPFELHRVINYSVVGNNVPEIPEIGKSMQEINVRN